LPSASISYTGSPFCATGTASVSRTGFAGGTYSSKVGLSLDNVTGTINLGASSPGTYTVTYSFGTGTCKNSTTTSIDINPLPVANIAYSGSPYCPSGIASVTQTGQTGGSYSSTLGLVIDNISGDIDLGLSKIGSYTVTYTFLSGACSNTTTTNITINALPIATIAYIGTPFCPSGNAKVTITGITGGTFSSSSGLIINSSTGTIDLKASTPGSYSIKYTFGSGSCVNSMTTNITINPLPILVINNPATVIAPATVNLKSGAITFGSSPGLTYTYFKDAAATLILTNPTAISKPGTYYIIGTNSNGCSVIMPVTVSINGDVFPVPIKDSTSTTSGNRITITNLITNDIPGTYDIDSSSVDLNPITLLKETSITLIGEGTFSVNSIGSLTFTPEIGFSGTAQVSYSITDKKGNKSKVFAPIIITVYPLAINDTSSTVVNNPLNLNILHNDLGNLDPTTLTIISNPINGKLTIDGSTGMIIYTPMVDFLGKDQFTYQICDKSKPNALCSDTATVFISVNAPYVAKADVSISKNVVGAVNSNTINYSFTVNNKGPNTASKVRITDILPAGMSYVSYQIDREGKDSVVFNANTNTFNWVIDSIPNGNSRVLTISVSTPNIGLITNIAQVSAKELDPDLKNNSSTAEFDKTSLDMFIPTVFTPNGDGKNDAFTIPLLKFYPNNELQVFNRWGNQVFHASSYMSSGNLWDGNNLGEGTYFYVLKINSNGISKKYGGYTTIVRNSRK
jgi:gliding motility-associated-like protein/uncharacterized repeat protein (TIGR01451 family)